MTSERIHYPQVSTDVHGSLDPIGQQLRLARQAASMTVRQVATALRVSPATWSAIENGRTQIRPDRLAAVKELLGSYMNGDPPITSRYVLAWREYAPLELPAPLRGALKAFVEFGYHGATIRAIADYSGLSVPGIYHHYPSKQDLLRALHEITMTDLLWRAQSARDEGTNPRDRLSYLIECLALYHTHRRELSFLGASEMRGLYPENRARIVRFRQEIQQMVDDEIIEGCHRGLMTTSVPMEAARAIVIMCTGIARWWSPNGPQTPEMVASQYVCFALGLLGGL